MVSSPLRKEELLISLTLGFVAGRAQCSFCFLTMEPFLIIMNQLIFIFIFQCDDINW